MTEEQKRTNFRRGPTPLPVHIGLALAEYSCMQKQDGVPQQKMEKMLSGIRKYQNHPFSRAVEDLPVVWQQGEVRIYKCGAGQARASVLLIPSLINKSFILDLLPEKSFVRWLAAQGVDAYLLDWGRPVDDLMLQTMDVLMSERLGPAIGAVAAMAQQKIHALGYCMGGTLLAAAALLYPEHLRGAVFLASPWDFEAGDRKLTDQVIGGTAAALQMAEQNGCLPMDWIQSVFAAVNADRAMQKFSEFDDLDDTSEEARLFVAVEDWLNEGVDMPRGLAQTCIVDWFGLNRPGRGTWTVAGQAVDIGAMPCPALVVASRNDRLVPRESSLALAREIPGAALLEPSSGHIGMMTGRRARIQVWEPVAAWLCSA